jgi:hypothetical protein
MTSYFNPTTVVIRAFLSNLKDSYCHTYGSHKQDYAEIIQWSGSMALELIADSDALYHNLEHTLHVTSVGQEILTGKHMRDGDVTPKDWLNFIVSLLCHDIGYVKGICREDNLQTYEFATGVDNPKTFKVPFGSTDAALTKYHVDRGKLFVRERFKNNPYIDCEVVAANIELTKFPVPQDGDHRDTKNYPGLVRAADLIGQLSDPRYIKKIPALYHEFVETGEAAKNGWTSPEDVRKTYPAFFWKCVLQYIQDGMGYLKVTQLGKSYINSLLAGVFVQQFEEKLFYIKEN